MLEHLEQQQRLTRNQWRIIATANLGDMLVDDGQGRREDGRPVELVVSVRVIVRHARQCRAGADVVGER